jgi:hypothetical protein
MANEGMQRANNEAASQMPWLKRVDNNPQKVIAASDDRP